MVMARRQRVLPDLDRSGGFIGICGLACVLFLDLAVAGALRWWAVTGLVLVWLVLFALGCRWFVDRPRRVLVLPLVGLAVWVGAVVAYRLG
jgi:hypothetical protein